MTKAKAKRHRTVPCLFFIKGMEEIGKIVRDNPGLPYAKKIDWIWRKENEGTEPG